MSEFEFVYEHVFIAELDAIEPNQFKQTYLIMRIENACIYQIMAGTRGHGFARIQWTRDLIAWFQATGTTVSLQSLKHDEIALDMAA